MKRCLPVIALGLAVLAGPAAAAAAQPAVSTFQVASFVNVCKTSRGVFDRRACGGKDDPRRHAVA